MVFPSLRLDINMYILFSFTSQSKDASKLAAEQAVIDNFVANMRDIILRVDSLSQADLASQISAQLVLADDEDAYALAAILGYVRNKVEFLVQQLRGDIAHALTNNDIRDTLTAAVDFVASKAAGSVPTVERSAGVDAVGFRLARNLGGAGQQACLFGYLCIDIESTLEFGAPSVLQRCGRTDPEIFEPVPQGNLAIHSHGRITKVTQREEEEEEEEE